MANFVFLRVSIDKVILFYLPLILFSLKDSLEFISLLALLINQS